MYRVKKWLAIGLVTVIIATTLGVWLPFRMDISADKGYVSISLGSQIAYAQEPEVGEVVEKRTRTSKTEYLGNGRYAIDTSIGAIHYNEPNWQPIQNEIVNDQMTEDDYSFKILQKTFDAGQVVEFSSQGEYVRFQPMELQWTSDLNQIQSISMPQKVTGVVSNELSPIISNPKHKTGIISWDNAYGTGRDFEWRTSPNRLSKILSIDDLLPTPASYIVTGGNPVLRLNLIFAPSDGVDVFVNGKKWDKSTRTQTFDIISFDKKTGGNVWNFMPIRYWDSEGNEGIAISELRRAGGNLYISLRVPYTWLQTAIYPVYIDPTLDLLVGASSDDCYRRLVTDGFSTTEKYLFVGDYSDNTYDYSSGMRWIGVTIPQGSTIDVAYFSLCACTKDGSMPTTRIYGDDEDNAATFSTASDYDNRPRTTAYATWTPAAWAGGTWYNSASIVSVIKEIIDRASWASGNALALFWRYNEEGWGGVQARLYAYSYDQWSGYAPKLHIEYTEAGGEPAAEVDPTSYNFGVQDVNTSITTGINYFTVTNTGDGSIDIEIKGIDLTGGNDTWTLSDTGTPNANTIGLYAGLDDADDLYDIVIKKNSPYNTLVASLAEDATQDWGMKLYMPTSVTNYEGQVMTGTVTLIVSAS